MKVAVIAHWAGRVGVGLALAAAMTLGGCAEVTNLTGLSTSQQVSIVKAIPCVTNNAALAAEGVEAKDINGKPIADQDAQDITQLIYLGSSAACALVGGTAQAAVSVPAAAVTALPTTTQ